MTTEPTHGVMMRATGIPPQVNHARLLQTMMENVIKVYHLQKDMAKNMIDTIKTSIHDEFEQRSFESGHVTNERLNAILAELQAKQETCVNAGITEMTTLMKRNEQLLKHLTTGVQVNHGVRQSDIEVAPSQYEGKSTYMFIWGAGSGRIANEVPENYKIPNRIDFKIAINFWLKGIRISVDGSQRIRPFRELNTQLLPQKL